MPAGWPPPRCCCALLLRRQRSCFQRLHTLVSSSLLDLISPSTCRGKGGDFNLKGSGVGELRRAGGGDSAVHDRLARRSNVQPVRRARQAQGPPGAGWRAAVHAWQHGPGPDSPRKTAQRRTAGRGGAAGEQERQGSRGGTRLLHIVVCQLLHRGLQVLALVLCTR